MDAAQPDERYPDLKPILVEDALYANAPHILQITGWLFVLNVKPDSHENLERQFVGRRASGQVKELRITDPQGSSITLTGPMTSACVSSWLM